MSRAGIGFKCDKCGAFGNSPREAQLGCTCDISPCCQQAVDRFADEAKKRVIALQAERERICKKQSGDGKFVSVATLIVSPDEFCNIIDQLKQEK